MKGNHKKSTENELSIKIGENKFSFTPESKKSIDLEILLLNFLRGCNENLHWKSR